MHELEQYLRRGNRKPARPLSSKNGNRALDSLDEFSDAVDERMRMRIYLPGEGDDGALIAYGQYLAGLLRGQLLIEHAGLDGRSMGGAPSDQACDLLILTDPKQSVFNRVLFGPSARRVARNATTTVLLARQPCWPIRRILLVMRVEASEALAVDWAGRLASSTGAHLTILPLVPSQPLMYGAASRLQVGIESLLTPSTPSGELLRQFLDDLRLWRVEGTLRVRQGDPLWQICWECDVGGYDLVIVGAEHRSRAQRWLFGELVSPLIAHLNRPLLIASWKQRCLLGSGH